MTIEINSYVAVLAVCLVVFGIGARRENALLIIPSFIVAAITLTVWAENSEWKQAQRRADAEQAKRDATPHVIREADGCKVYAFKSGEWHYFTRCGDTVTTERNWTERVNCGKNCTKSVPHKEVIVTKENQ